MNDLLSLVQIVREDSIQDKTPGRFLCNGSFWAYSLEDLVRPKGQFVDDKTAIDFGRYELTMSYSNRFKMQMPLILNLQKASPPILFHGVDVSLCGLRIHGGNTAEDSEGCPMMGSRKVPFGDCKKINADFRTWLTRSIKSQKVFLEIGKMNSSGKFYIPTTW